MEKQIKLFADDFTLPLGFVATGIAAGIKKNNSLDLGVIFSSQPAQAAGLFTTSKFTGHCIDICRAKLQKKVMYNGVIASSGNSNTATGHQGFEHSQQMIAELISKLQEKNPGAELDFLISHTGVIGVPLPITKILSAVPFLAENINKNLQAKSNGQQQDFARAIMTTDTRPKSCSAVVQTDKGEYRISGVVKGAGMIAPNMATMLCYITSDAAVDGSILKTSLEIATDQSFNSITIDGDMSPDDSIIVLANGQSGVSINSEEEVKQFQDALNQVTEYLAREMVKDGEGATKFIVLHVQGAKNDAQAKKAGLVIANSSLVKTAFFGEDANWGRIITALGYSKVDFSLQNVELSFGDHVLFTNGVGQLFDEQVLKKYLQQPEIHVYLDLGEGSGKSRIFTQDLSVEYIHINADYRS